MIVISGIHIYLTATATAPSMACSSRICHPCSSSTGHACQSLRARAPYDTALLIELGLQICGSTRHAFDCKRLVVASNLTQDLCFRRRPCAAWSKCNGSQLGAKKVGGCCGFLWLLCFLPLSVGSWKPLARGKNRSDRSLFC